ncbi:hypothetical protein BJX61DRAFT_539994 [Aspergillus egyptiacus]|nr:hypothetical protein BJX61DRAFT_539994 [Aspergillus egyptiacus]
MAANWLVEVDPAAAAQDLIPDFRQTMMYMEQHPQHASEIFSWGTGSTGPWPNHVYFQTHNDVLNWHRSKASSSAPLTQPIAAATVQANIAAERWPIDHLIRRNRAAALRQLRLSRLWDPRGYSPRGMSYLRLAHESGAHDVFDCIMEQVISSPEFARSYTTSPFVTGVRDNRNHLDFVLSISYPLFRDWWKQIHQTPDHNLDAKRDLSTDSHIQLCKSATRKFAEYLHRVNGFHLAETDSTTVRGTVYHLALENPNTNFIDFLSSYPHHRPNSVSVDARDDHMQTPLELARTTNKLRHFEKLLHAGADVDALVAEFIDDLALTRNPWLRVASAHYRTINPPTRALQPGVARSPTLLHMVLQSLKTKLDREQTKPDMTPAKMAAQRRKYVKRAADLIALFRAGSKYGRPDLTMRLDVPVGDILHTATAQELARVYNFPELVDALEINPGPLLLGEMAQVNPVVWMQRRGHRYPTRRGNHLRGIGNL